MRCECYLPRFYQKRSLFRAILSILFAIRSYVHLWCHSLHRLYHTIRQPNHKILLYLKFIAPVFVDERQTADNQSHTQCALTQMGASRTNDAGFALSYRWCRSTKKWCSEKGGKEEKRILNKKLPTNRKTILILLPSCARLTILLIKNCKIHPMHQNLIISAPNTARFS